jgi:hypothetical protein
MTRRRVLTVKTLLATISCRIRGAEERCIDWTTFSCNWTPSEITSGLDFSSGVGD